MNTGVITLSWLDLALTACLILLLAVIVQWQRLGITRQLLINATRTVVQLLLVGLVLKAVFDNAHLGWLTLISLVMVGMAGYEVIARQKQRFTGFWSYGIGVSSMFVSAFTVTLMTLLVIIEPEPWYQPQYSIPLLGMMLGNTLNGVSLALDRFTSGVMQQRRVIEARLILGHSGPQAVQDLMRESIRTGLIPIVNAMAAAGIVSLPGMMTGQILSGTPPLEAVKYQILIMFIISTGTGFSTLMAIRLSARRLFDSRQRLRIDRLRTLK